MGIIYHLTLASYYESLDKDADYLPAEFDADRFVHCSAGKEQLLRAANRYYKDAPGDFVLLTIDEDALHAELRYEQSMPNPAADGELFPHVFGPLNRDAITEVRPIHRAADGSFER